MGVIDPVRVYDSRSAGGPVGIGQVGVQITGWAACHAGATVAMLSVTTVTGGQGSSVFLVPCGEGPQRRHRDRLVGQPDLDGGGAGAAGRRRGVHLVVPRRST